MSTTLAKSFSHAEEISSAMAMSGAETMTGAGEMSYTEEIPSVGTVTSTGKVKIVKSEYNKEKLIVKKEMDYTMSPTESLITFYNLIKNAADNENMDLILNICKKVEKTVLPYYGVHPGYAAGKFIDVEDEDFLKIVSLPVSEFKILYKTEIEMNKEFLNIHKKSHSKWREEIALNKHLYQQSKLKLHKLMKYV